MFEDLFIRPTFFDNALVEAANSFFNRVEFYDEGPMFVETEDGYKMDISLEGASLDNVTIEVEDEKYLKVSYFNQTETSSSAFSAKEFIPSDADTSTIDASYVDSTLTITVKRK